MQYDSSTEYAGDGPEEGAELNMRMMPQLWVDLKEQGYRVSPLVGLESAIVTAPWGHKYAGQSFWVWDNGGELGVELINSGVLARFTPLPGHSRETCLGRLTLLSRCLLIMADEAIDYGGETLDSLEETTEYLRAHETSKVAVAA